MTIEPKQAVETLYKATQHMKATLEEHQYLRGCYDCLLKALQTKKQGKKVIKESNVVNNGIK